MNAKRMEHIIEYTVFLVKNFAGRFEIDMRDAFNYLNRYEGIRYIENNYDFEHTQNPDYTVETLRNVCRKNGGEL
ncbi:MAG: DUF3791 domain-containing protein [Dysgonamonadaceae bacterium]|jgi:hypothetical protein|nr:DUF3791 domain-containing protein [Dysgonamonadaceae bacterium]